MSKRRRTRVAAGSTMAVLGLLLAGCGTIFGGLHQTVRIDSTPTAAEIRTEPESGVYTTPASIELERKHSYTLTFTKEGYTPATFRLRRGLREWALALDILTGLIGVVVDAATGGWYDLNPEEVAVTLERADSGIEGPARIEVSVTLDDDGRTPVLRLESSAPGVSARIERD